MYDSSPSESNALPEFQCVIYSTTCYCQTHFQTCPYTPSPFGPPLAPQRSGSPPTPFLDPINPAGAYCPAVSVDRGGNPIPDMNPQNPPLVPLHGSGCLQFMCLSNNPTHSLQDANVTITEPYQQGTAVDWFGNPLKPIQEQERGWDSRSTTEVGSQTSSEKFAEKEMDVYKALYSDTQSKQKPGLRNAKSHKHASDLLPPRPYRESRRHRVWKSIQKTVGDVGLSLLICVLTPCSCGAAPRE